MGDRISGKSYIGLFFFCAMEALAAAAVVVATASIACGNAATVVTAAAEEDEYKDDDPRAISAKTVVTHYKRPPFCVFITYYAAFLNVLHSKKIKKLN